MENNIPNCFYRVSVKALVLDDTKNKFLLLKEDDGMWDFPWWWLDFWEDPRSCIIRELKEETWLEVLWIDNKPSYFVIAEKPEYHCWLAHVFYETKLKNIIFTPSEECQEIKFVTKEEAETMNILPNVVAFLKQYTF